MKKMTGVMAVLLLIVFSVQGLGLAAGVKFIHAGRILAHQPQHHVVDRQKTAEPASTTAAAGEQDSFDFDNLKILSISEELSDYMAFEFAFPVAENFAPLADALTWTPASVTLPRSLPPPRS